MMVASGPSEQVAIAENNSTKNPQKPTAPKMTRGSQFEALGGLVVGVGALIRL